MSHEEQDHTDSQSDICVLRVPSQPPPPNPYNIARKGLLGSRVNCLARKGVLLLLPVLQITPWIIKLCVLMWVQLGCHRSLKCLQPLLSEAQGETTRLFYAMSQPFFTDMRVLNTFSVSNPVNTKVNTALS